MKINLNLVQKYLRIATGFIKLLHEVIKLLNMTFNYHYNESKRYATN
jgi:hypothetical protein